MRTPLLALLVASTASVLALTVTGASAVAQSEPSPAVTEQPNLVYATVDGEPILLDAYLPATTPKQRPAVVLIHGGGWGTGTSTDFVDYARQLALVGFVVFSINYRLAPAHPYPAAVDDVRAAIRWLRAPAQVAAFHIDPTRIGTWGASAGGHLAGMLATLGRGSLAKGARVRVAISWSGPMDFTLESGTYSSVMPPDDTPVPAFLHCSYADAGCAATEAAASPITHVDKTDAPMLLANSEGELVPPNQATRMADALKAAHVKYQLIIYPGVRHAGAFGDDAFPPTLAFLERYLGKPVAPTAG
jgi:acetyl esterase